MYLLANLLIKLSHIIGRVRPHAQGWIKGGGETAPGPPLQGGPGDDIYLF